MTLAWLACAVWVAWADFAQPAPVTWLLAATSAYLLGVGVVQQATDKRDTMRPRPTLFIRRRR
jgi:hypothetical protein